MTEQEKDEIMQALRGDMKGTPGLIQNMLRVVNDLYTPPDGISPRLRKLEEWRLSREERAAGAIWALRITWGALFFALGFLFKLVFKF